MIVAAVGATAVLAGAVHGAFHRNSPIFGRVLTRLPRNGRPRVSLTFDDGPNPDATPVILDALRARGVRATFFVLGRHAERWPELVERTAIFTCACSSRSPVPHATTLSGGGTRSVQLPE